MLKLEEKVKVLAHASSANLGPGFDIFGMALDAFYDIVEIERINGEKIIIENYGKYGNTIPKDPRKNVAGVVAKSMLNHYFGKKIGLKISIFKGVKPSSGLGSSGATAAATALALKNLFKINASIEELIYFAAQGEKASAGTPHMDNVAASLLGNFTLIYSTNPPKFINLKVPENIEVAIVSPEIKIKEKAKTKYARKILPKKVELEKVVHNVGHACLIVAGFLLSNINLIGEGMSDRIIEPARSKIVPFYEKIRNMALKNGAAGVAISGAGPSIIALVDSSKIEAMKIAECMKELFEKNGIKAEAYVSKIGKEARLLKENSW
ncbi:MAG: homoserine kinase [Nitrososphaerota archaeon]